MPAAHRVQMRQQDWAGFTSQGFGHHRALRRVHRSRALLDQTWLHGTREVAPPSAESPPGPEPSAPPW